MYTAQLKDVTYRFTPSLFNYTSSPVLFMTNCVANTGKIYASGFQNLAAAYILVMQSHA